MINKIYLIDKTLINRKYYNQERLDSYSGQKKYSELEPFSYEN